MKGKHHLTFLRLKGHLAVYALDQPRPSGNVIRMSTELRVDVFKKIFSKKQFNFYVFDYSIFLQTYY